MLVALFFGQVDSLMSNLFRNEVMQAQGRLHGDVVLASPLSNFVFTCLLTAIVAGLIVFAVTGSFPRKETVPGWLEPQAGIARISAPAPAIVAEVFVREGTHVDRDAPLFRLSLDAGLSGGATLSQSTLHSLSTERRELEGRLAMTPDRFGSQERQLTDRIKGLRLEAEQLRGQIDVQQQRVALATQQRETFASLLEKGTVSRIEVQARQESEFAQRQTLAGLEQRLTALYSEIGNETAELEALPLARESALSELRGRIAIIDRQISEAESRGNVFLHAPMSGVVTSILAEPGESVSPQFVLATILPPGAELQGYLLVPTRAVGFIEIGQPVNMLYEAFPYQKYGAHAGTVVDISQTSLRPGEFNAHISSQEPVYILTVALARQSVDAQGREIPLRAGMLFRADIIIERRKLWEWLLEPLLGTSRRSS